MDISDRSQFLKIWRVSALLDVFIYSLASITAIYALDSIKYQGFISNGSPVFHIWNNINARNLKSSESKNLSKCRDVIRQ